MLSNVVIKEMPVAAKMTSEIYSSDCTAIFRPRMRLSGNSIVSRSLQSMPRHNPDVQKAIAFLEERYQEHLTLYDLAKQVSLSPYHLLRVFKAETGKTPLEFLTEIRIRHAKRLSNASHFSSVFKRKTGLTPSEFKDFHRTRI